MPILKLNAPYKISERISLGDRKVIVYTMSDTLRSFSRQRYVPVYGFEVVDETSNVVATYIGAYQIFLSRVAGTLRPDQKILLTPSEQVINKSDSGRHSVEWSVPRFEGEVSDLPENTGVILTRYWSVDSLAAPKTFELFTTTVLSTPTQTRSVAGRDIAEALRVQREGEEKAYLDLKSFVLSRLR